MTTVVNKRYVTRYDVYIGRPSKWGNPFCIGRDGDRHDVIRKYRVWLRKHLHREEGLWDTIIKELRGRTLACYCKPEDCHGDVLAELAEGRWI